MSTKARAKAQPAAQPTVDRVMVRGEGYGTGAVAYKMWIGHNTKWARITKKGILALEQAGHIIHWN